MTNSEKSAIQNIIASSLKYYTLLVVVVLSLSWIQAATASESNQESDASTKDLTTSVASNHEFADDESEAQPIASPTGSEAKRTTYISESRCNPPQWFRDQGYTKDGIEFLPIREGGAIEVLPTEAKELVERRVANYIDELCGEHASHYVHYSFDQLQARGLIANAEVVPAIDLNTGEPEDKGFYFAMLQFDDRFRDEVQNQWREQRQSSRLIQTGLIAGSVLLSIGFLFGTLRLNTATSGFYQGRLQFLGSIVVLGIIAASIYYGLQLDWI